MTAFTTARPGDITITEGYGDAPYCICWKDHGFKIMKPEAPSPHSNKHGLRLMCKLTFGFCKGSKNDADL